MAPPARAEVESFDDNAKLVYYNPEEPASYGGVKRLAKRLNDRHGQRTAQWLRGQDAYTLHRPATRRFPRRKTIVRGPGVQLQADLMDVSSHAARNDDTRFLLTTVDAFSRLARVVPLRNKGGKEVARGLKKAIGGLGYKLLQTDKGTEFRNDNVRALLQSEGIRWFSSQDDVIKASLVERFNKTLRGKIHAHLTYTREGRYIDSLPAMVRGYNRAYHSTLDMAPDDVDEENAGDVFIRLYEPRHRLSTPRKARFAVGDHVRTTKFRGAFTRGYAEQWTREIFVVHRVRLDQSPVTYELKDLAGEPILGTYYAKELQRVAKPETFIVERVIRSTGRGRTRKHLVKWLGYPDSFNSWIADTDFV